MKRLDIALALITGEITAFFFFGLLKNLGVEQRILLWSLPIFFPILAVLALWISWILGKKFLFIYQLAKFLLIGVLATFLDLGVLNLLILASGIATGLPYSIFKGISFVVATFGKYWGNKFWAFEKIEMTGMEREFSQFFLITLIGLVLNVGIASWVVSGIGPQFGITERIWANIGAIVAALFVAAWNFLGYKFIVFKK